jgi:predicted RNA binding protein with dsRBD fold (UPF0201 family)
MTRGSLTVTVTPSKKSLGPVTVNVEVENIERVMKDLHDIAPGVQSADILFRILRRL